MDYLFYFLTVVFLAKILWNFSIPVIAASIKKRGCKQESISLMPVELVVLLVIILYSHLRDGFNIFGLGTLYIAVVGGALICLSYLSLILFSKWQMRSGSE